MSESGLAKAAPRPILRCDIQANVTQMPAKPDRRVERTRAALTSAFVALILGEGYDAVTVERVAARANVGRSTFYMHFKSREDILRLVMTNPSSLLAAMVGGDIAIEHIMRQLEHFHGQRARNHVFFTGTVRTLWVRRLAEMIEPRLEKLARQERARLVIPLSLAALQIAEAQIGLVANWLTSRPPLAKLDAVAEALLDGTRALTRMALRASRDAPLLIAGEKLRVVDAQA
jgi:AcrR family transcriptional regulator